MNRTYIAIDLKSYYASVECADRHLNPLTTNLVVADASRTEKTICLAVSPSLKAYGIGGRARLFEVVQKVKEINADRFRRARQLNILPKDEAGNFRFTSASFDAEALAGDPGLELSYITAPPRMKLYETVSTKIFGIYMKYVSSEDIHVYSIDECFIDVTGYLETYRMTARSLAVTMIREVLYATGITATAGIGTNLYLAKIAMDIVAKHVPADQDGVRIAELDEMRYRKLLWCHTPLTDFWRVGPGTARRMLKLGCRTMGDIARLSELKEELIYRALGVNAELLIDHAWGWEPTEIRTIKSYIPETTSLSSGQVLSEPYPFEKAELIVREMTELLVLDLVRKDMVTKKIGLHIGYDRESIRCEREGKSPEDSVFLVCSTGKRYRGTVTTDHYGRLVPKHAGGTGNLDRWTSSTRRIVDAMMRLYRETTDPDLLVRRVTVTADDLIRKEDIPEEAPCQMDLFTDYGALEKKKAEEEAEDRKEHQLQKAVLELQDRYGKNAVLKGMNLLKGGTTVSRNGQIGGHRA